jgi:ATP-dependent Lon protease
MDPDTAEFNFDTPLTYANAATVPDAQLRQHGRHQLTTLIEVSALEARLADTALSRTARERLNPALMALAQAPAGWRRQVRVGRHFATRLAALRTHFPQCAAVMDYIEAMVHLACRGDRVLRLPPMLLVGPPGVGKTYFAARMAATLRLPYEEIHMESATAGWILTGGDSAWSESKPGRIFELLVHGRYANPVVLLDEIDKVPQGQKYDPMGPIYGLLEPHTASRFRDEYACVPMDASRINWILTANVLEHVPLPIRSRTQVFHIPEPSFTQRMAIAHLMYEKLLRTESWGAAFNPALDETTSVRLAEATGSARDLRQTLMLACARAATRGADALLPCDVDATDERVLRSGIDLRSAAPMGNA